MPNFEEAQNIFNSALDILPEPYNTLSSLVIGCPRFKNGYGAKNHHHNYEGGLYIHTAEVLDNCMGAADTSSVPMDVPVLFTAAIWHDYMKIKDYEKDSEGNIQYTKYKNLIYHVAGSFAAFKYEADRLIIPEDKRDHICHCILSHHGRPEWGSAITPRTREALTLHWADCMSAWFENGNYKEKE